MLLITPECSRCRFIADSLAISVPRKGKPNLGAVRQQLVTEGWKCCRNKDGDHHEYCPKCVANMKSGKIPGVP